LQGRDPAVNLDQHPVTGRDGAQGAFGIEGGLGHGQGLDGLKHAVGKGPQPHPPLFERQKVGGDVVKTIHQGMMGAFSGEGISPTSPSLQAFWRSGRWRASDGH
jgi:hypothetical protein